MRRYECYPGTAAAPRARGRRREEARSCNRSRVPVLRRVGGTRPSSGPIWSRSIAAAGDRVTPAPAGRWGGRRVARGGRPRWTAPMHIVLLGAYEGAGPRGGERPVRCLPVRSHPRTVPALPGAGIQSRCREGVGSGPDGTCIKDTASATQGELPVLSPDRFGKPRKQKRSTERPARRQMYLQARHLVRRPFPNEIDIVPRQERTSSTHAEYM